MLSNQYSISNAVKQGGCLLPTLFSIYLNDLIDVQSTELVWILDFKQILLLLLLFITLF